MSFSLGSARGSVVIDYLGDGVQRAIGDMNRLSGASSTMADGMVAGGKAAVAAGAAIGLPLLGAVNAAADFEFGLDAVNAALGGMDTSTLDRVSEQAQTLGADTKFSANEILGVQEQLAKSGLSAEQLLGGATQAVTDLSAATGEDLVASGVAAAAAINLFGLDAEQIPAVADTITAGLNNSSATLNDFKTGVNALGPVMANLNRYADDPLAAFQDTAAAVAFFNANGLKAADAGISLARGMTNLADPTSDASAKLAELGISAFDANNDFLPLPDLFDQLNSAMSGMSDQAREQALATIFGAEAADVMNQAIKKGGDPLREYEELTRQQGIAAEQAAIRQDNLRGAIEELGGAIETAGVALGTPLLGPLQSLAEGIKGIVEAFIGLDPAVQGFIATFAALSSGLLLVGGGAALAVGQILRLGQAFAAAGLSLGRFMLAFGLLGAALGVGILAYQNNWLGFGDAIDATVAKAQKAARVFGAAFSSRNLRNQYVGMNNLASAVEAFGYALDLATGIDITGFTGTLAAGIDAFGDALEENLANGVNPWVAGISAASEAARAMGFEGIADGLLNLARGAQTFADTWERVRDITGEQRYSGLAADIDALGIALDEAFGVNLTGPLGGLADALDAFALAADRAASEGAGPLEQAFRGMQAAIESATGLDLSGFADALGNVGGTIRDVASAISTGDWDQVGAILSTALQDLSTYAQEGLQGLSDFLTEKFNDLGASIGSIDLEGVVVNFGEWVMGNVVTPIADWVTANTAVDLSDGVDVGDVQVVWTWVQGKILDLQSWLSGIFGGGGSDPNLGIGTGVSGASGLSIDLGAIPINIDADAMRQQLGDLLLSAIQVDASVVGEAKRLGEQIGTEVGTSLSNAIEAGLAAIDAATAEGAGGGPPPGQGGSLGIGATTTGGMSWVTDAVTGFAEALVTSFRAAIEEQFTTAEARIQQHIRDRRAEFMGAVVDELFGGGADPLGLGIGGESEASKWVKDNVGPAAENLADGVPNNMFPEGTDAEVKEGVGQAVTTNIGDPAVAGIEEGGTDVGAKITEAAGGVADFISDTFFTGLLIPIGAGASAAKNEGADAARGAIADQLSGVGEGPEITAAAEQASATMVDQWIAGVTAQVEATPPSAFQGLGTAFGAKLNEGIGLALTEGATTGAQPASETGTGAVALSTAQQIVTTLATSLATAVQGVDPGVFAATGQAVMAKLGESLGQAMNAEGTAEHVGSGQVATVGTGVGQQIVTSLAASLATSITSAPAEAFATAGSALMGKISEAMTAAMSGTGPAFEGGRVGADAAGGIGGGIVTGLATSLATSIASAPIEAFAALGTAISTKISEAINLAMTVSASGAGGNFGPGGMTGTGGGTGGGIGSQIALMLATSITGADFSSVATALQTQMSTTVQTAFTQMQATVLQAIGAITQGVSAGLSSLIPIVQNAFMSMANTATANMAAMQAAVLAAIGAMTAGVSASMTALIGVVQNAFMSMSNAATANMAAMQAAVLAAIGAMTQGIGASMTAMIGVVQNAFSSMANTITSNMQAAVSAVQGAVASIQAALEGAAAGANAAGVAVGQGFADGISSMQGAVEEAAQSLANAALGAIQAVAAIASPSKVTTQYGQDTGQGYANGIASMTGEVATRVSEMVAAGMARLEDALAAMEARLERFKQTTTDTATATGEGLSGALDEAAGTTDAAATEMGKATGEQTAQGIDESTAQATGAATDLGAATGEALGEGLDACAPTTAAIDEATGCATDAIGSTMEPAVTEAAGTAMDATGASMTEAAGEAGTAAGTNLGDSMVQAMLGQMQLGGDGIAGQAMQAALGDIGGATADAVAAGTEVGTAMGDAAATGVEQSAGTAMEQTGAQLGADLSAGVGTGLDLTPEALGIPEAGRALAERLMGEVQARLGVQETARNSWLGSVKGVVDDTNARARDMASMNQRRVQIEVPVMLDRDVIGRVAAEATVGGMLESSPRNPLARRRRP